MIEILKDIDLVFEPDALLLTHIQFVDDFNGTEFTCRLLLTLLHSSKGTFTQNMRVKFVVLGEHLYVFVFNHEV